MELAHDAEHLAAELEKAERELRLAREQAKVPKHLRIRARAEAVRAARAVDEAIQSEYLATDGWLSLCRPHESDGQPRPMLDHECFWFWTFAICPAMRSRDTLLPADAGRFDSPDVKTDENGRVLGRDGKPLRTVETIDANGQKYLTKPDPPARITDDYNETDMLEHFRLQARDWADACAIAARLIRARTIGLNAVSPSNENGKVAADLTAAGLAALNEQLNELPAAQRADFVNALPPELRAHWLNSRDIPHDAGKPSAPTTPQELRNWCADIADEVLESLRRMPGAHWQSLIDDGWRYAQDIIAASGYKLPPAPPLPDCQTIDDARRAIDVLIRWCDGLISTASTNGGPAGDALSLTGPTVSEPVLSPTEQNALIAMLELKAIDPNSRRTAADITVAADGAEADTNTYKRPLSELKGRKLVLSKIGQAGGSWLTEAGKKLAEKLRDNQLR